MNESIQARLRHFTTALLERREALVECPTSADEGWAMLPPGLAGQMGGSELLRLSHKPESGGLCLNLAADFIDRMTPLLQMEPRVALYQIPEAYLKKSAMDEPVVRAFSWLNAKVRVKSARAERVEYHVWSYLATLKSDDLWEDLITLSLNSASGAEVALPEPAGMLDLAGNATPPPFKNTQATANILAAAQVEKRAAQFLARLESRLDRDHKRLRDYYTALLKDSKSAKAKDDEGAKPEQNRAAVELELRRKTLELDERYQMGVQLTPLTLTRIELPVLAVECDVLRKQAKRSLDLYWNPLLTALEPMACGNCCASVFAVAFTDDDVSPRCSACT